jgi:tRNA A37 threonylcarbamoyladenosine dehydratase
LLPGETGEKKIKKEKINKGIRCVFSNEIQKEESLKMTDGTNFKNLSTERSALFLLFSDCMLLLK